MNPKASNIDIDYIIRNTKRFQGRRELIKHLRGERLTRQEAIKATCFDCTGWYADGAYDCEIETCPLYPYMPYRGKRGSNSSDE